MFPHHFLRTEMIPSPHFHKWLHLPERHEKLCFEAKGTGAEGNEGDGETAASNTASPTLVAWMRAPSLRKNSCGPKPAWQYLDGQLMRDWVSPSASIWRDQSVPWFALTLYQQKPSEWVRVIQPNPDWHTTHTKTSTRMLVETKPTPPPTHTRHTHTMNLNYNQKTIQFSIPDEPNRLMLAELMLQINADLTGRYLNGSWLLLLPPHN